MIQNNQIYGSGKKLPYVKNSRTHFGGKKNATFWKAKMRQKDNYVMVKTAISKQVLLPDSRIFIVRYERVSSDTLPPNVTIRRRYKQRAVPKNRTRQAGRGLSRAFSSMLNTEEVLFLEY